MTNVLLDGPVSVGCPLSSRHPLVELQCAEGGDFANVRDPIPYISLPGRLLGGRCRGVDRPLFRKLKECVCVCGLNFLGELHVFWVSGRQGRCCLKAGLYVRTQISSCSSAQRRL